MKRLIAITLLITGSLWAQSTLSVPAKSVKSNPPSTSQQYCAGFISHNAISRQNHIVASKDAPHEDEFAGGSVLFIAGPTLKEGERYSILRETKDPNREEFTPEISRKMARLGRLYQELGWVTVHNIAGKISIASFDFSCDAAVPGDIVVPFEAKPEISVRGTDDPINPYVSGNAINGHILGSKDALGLLGTGSIVYLDYGANKGAKVGEYLFIRRGYTDAELNTVDRISERLPKGAAIEAANPVKVTADDQKKLPAHLLGEVVLLDVRETASTGYILRSFAEIQLGDAVEEEEGGAAVAAHAEPAATPAATPCTDSALWRRALFLGHKCK
ncbi:MAG: hypothetical protein P4M01_01990 [Acidobacteriota bacterium]|nr:hypothetical protein [Acidobacteriota bacterium]